MNPRVLIVDDVQSECRFIADALRAHDLDSVWVTGGFEALEVLESQPFDVVLTDLNMPKMSGVALCRRISEITPNLPVVVITAFGSIDSAVEAMKAGAYDFVTKPFDVDSVCLVIRRAVEHRALKCELDALRQVVDKSKSYGNLLGTSEAMRRTYSLIDRIGASDAPLLITGESGTGKELVAREIHERGSGASGPFVVINCATIPGSSFESELLGQGTGEASEAAFERQGLLAAACGGTLLFDEIGDMPMELQPRLLGLLQEDRIRSARGPQEACLNPRIIATTNRDLDGAVEEGRMRRELFYRINVLRIDVPPLRARGGDTLLLVQHFLSEIAVRNGKPVTGITARAAERLLAYDWPGNVRELRNAVERAVALCRSEFVDLEDLPEKVRDYKSEHVIVAGDDPSELVPLEEVERRYLLKVVGACKGNKSQAARVLGIGRKTLYRRLVALGISGAEEDPEG